MSHPSASAFALILASILLPQTALSGDTLPYELQTEHTWISTEYFGPNAFPVPDMLHNTAATMSFDVSGAYASGHLAETADRTFTLKYAFRLPLWTDRANLSVWGQALEWYRDTPEVRALRRVSSDKDLSGIHNGDIYFSIDLRLLDETGTIPCVTLRGACKTAYGGRYTSARYYDTPGYFIDACASKTWLIWDRSSLFFSASCGFLCWQVDNGRQNDAVMYGISADFRSPSADWDVELGGYAGWKDEGDRPLTLKLRGDIKVPGGITPFIRYEHGICNWPFNQIELGVKFAFARWLGH